MNAIIASRLQGGDNEARAAIAREQLIGLGHTRAEVSGLPDSYVLQLARMLSVPQPEELEPCPQCGTPARYLGGEHWNCDATDCRTGSFTRAQ